MNFETHHSVGNRNADARPGQRALREVVGFGSSGVRRARGRPREHGTCGPVRRTLEFPEFAGSIADPGIAWFVRNEPPLT